jgi:thiol-disulfide isomerase/thioredoxin
MDRAFFLQTLLAALAAPSPSPSSDPWDMCTTSPVLPYDHPLDLKMQTLDGPDFHLLSYRGSAVLLNIFATWCPPCNKEQPTIVELAAKYAPQGLVTVGINDREPDDVVRHYRKKYEIAFPIAMDRGGSFTQALQAGSHRDIQEWLPTSLFITPQGYLYCYIQNSLERDELDYRIKKFLAFAPPSVTPSPLPSAEI